MVIALVVAPLGGLAVTYKLYRGDIVLASQSPLARTGASIGGGAITTLVLISLAMLSVKFTKVIWRDHTYSPTAWASFKKEINISAHIYMVAVGFILIGMLHKCLKTRCVLMNGGS